VRSNHRRRRRGIATAAIALYSHLGVREDVRHFDMPVAVVERD
jgi:hypothetical protein